MKALLSLAFATALAGMAAADGINHLDLNNTTYTNINKVYVSSGNLVIILYPGGGTSASISKLPKDFLESWGIGSEKQAAVKEAVAEQDAKSLERAIEMGAFREVHGIVYDTRKRAAGWVTFPKAKVYQIVDAGALIDSTPDSDYTTVPVLVRNLPNTVGDTDYISFSAMPDGSYSYENKLGDDRVVRAYNAGTICTRSEIPESVLSGEKAYDIATGTDRSSAEKDVVASLPDSDDLMVSGSGFFITADGYFITNAHVVKNSRRVKLKMGSKVSAATVVRSDADADLALLKADGQFKPLPISTNSLELGQPVFTIGFPDIKLQGTEPKFTDGKVSSLNGLKDDPTEYQISVPVQPGNSGGPLVDQAGNVEGVIVARLDDFAALASVGSLPQNVNYAIKGSILRDFLTQSPDVKTLAATNAAAAPVTAVQQSVAIVLVY